MLRYRFWRSSIPLRNIYDKENEYLSSKITAFANSEETAFASPSFGKISAQPHTTLCIQFLDWENNDKNNRLPLGKQICFTIVWGCAEILPLFFSAFEYSAGQFSEIAKILRDFTKANWRKLNGKPNYRWRGRPFVKPKINNENHFVKYLREQTIVWTLHIAI